MARGRNSGSNPVRIKGAANLRTVRSHRESLTIATELIARCGILQTADQPPHSSGGPHRILRLSALGGSRKRRHQILLSGN